MLSGGQMDPMVGLTVGQYTIKRVIGSGGMGTVYEAMQQSPRRTVALKMLKQGIASRSALRRFEYEAQTLGRLRHAHIAQIYEAGTNDDGTGARPYFAMEYLAGAKPVTQYAREKKLGIRERLKLFASICNAANHGHQKGIIHRDLKPGNILVTNRGDPKIIDFGIARSTDSDMAVTTLQTDVGALIGTLQYMSPEQCDADPHDIDTRSDVYALGVVLYELLTDELPYNLSHQAIHEAARIVREEVPARPSTVNRILRGDVETISLKALEKDRDRRYQSAVELEQDIKRYLSGEPILARKASLGYQLQLLYRRHRVAVVLSGLTILLLLVSVVALSLFATLQSRTLNAMREADRQTTRSQDIIDNLELMLGAPKGADWPRGVSMEHVLDNAKAKFELLQGRIETEKEAQDAGSMAVVLARTYLFIGASDKARGVMNVGQEILGPWFPDDHPNLYDFHVVNVLTGIAEGHHEASLEDGKKLLARKSNDIGRFNVDTLGTAYVFANDLAKTGHGDTAAQLLGEHLDGMTYEEAVATMQAYDAVELLATIPASTPSPYLLALLDRVVPPGVTTLDEGRVIFVHDIAWNMGLENSHASAALEITERLEPVFARFPLNQTQRRRNRMQRALLMMELDRHAEAVVLLEKQLELDREDSSITDWQREFLINKLTLAREHLQEK